MTKHLLSLASLFAAAVLLVSCGKAPPAPAPDSAAAVTLADAAGRTVRLDRLPRRITITGKASFMIENAVYLFPEARERGLEFLGGHAGQRPDVGDFLSLVIPRRDRGGTLTGEAGIEQVAATRPDAVLMKSSARRAGNVMDQVGLPIVFLDLETPAQYERDLAILGRLLDAPESADRLIRYYRGITGLVGERTAPLPDAAKPRVLLLQYSDRNGTTAFSVPPPDWIQTELVERAGGRPVWKEAAERGGWTIVNLEQIAAWDPDIVLVVRYHGDTAQAAAAIRADSRWQTVRAVQTGHLLAFPGDYCSWDQPDPRWGLGLLWLAARLHPDRFPDVNFPEEIFRFYALYGLDADSVREHILPLLPEDLVHARN